MDECKPPPVGILLIDARAERLDEEVGVGVQEERHGVPRQVRALRRRVHRTVGACCGCIRGVLGVH